MDKCISHNRTVTVPPPYGYQPLRVGGLQKTVVGLRAFSSQPFVRLRPPYCVDVGSWVVPGVVSGTFFAVFIIFCEKAKIWGIIISKKLSIIWLIF
jgi:hypothetical protein